jgi:hypothetical protein
MELEPFVRYRARLTALANEGAARTALDAAPFWPAGFRWTPIFERFYPGAAPYAVQVFESRDGAAQSIARVEAFDAPSSEAVDGEWWSRHTVIGALRVTTLGADTSLPALASIVGDGTETTVVRYHPGLRCTVRTVRNGAEVFGKIFSDDRGRELCEDYERLWRASVAREISFNVARPIAWDEANRTLWQAAVPGCAVRPRLRTDEGPALARRIGEALGSLAQSHVRTRRAVSLHDEVERAERHAAELVCRVPSLAEKVKGFLRRTAVFREMEQSRAPRPIHGAPAAAQWLATAERLGLVDFDNFALGDPEVDIASLLANFDFEDVPRDRARELGTQFIEAWEGVAGPVDRVRLDFHRGHRHLRKALRAASAIRPDGDSRAAALLHRSAELLALNRAMA